MKTLGCLMFVATSLAVATPAWPQEYGSGLQSTVRPYEFNFGAALGVPLGSNADRFSVGGGFTAGVTYNPNELFGVLGEYSLSYYDVATGALGLEGIDGNSYLHYLDANLVVRPVQSGGLGIYLTAGPGIYYRRITLTEVTGVAVVPYCDPYLFFCYNSAVPATDVLATRDSWDLGVNGGIGATLGNPGGARFYAEARYHYIVGPEFTDQGGAKKRADGHYLPLVLGLKF